MASVRPGLTNQTAGILFHFKEVSAHCTFVFSFCKMDGWMNLWLIFMLAYSPVSVCCWTWANFLVQKAHWIFDITHRGNLDRFVRQNKNDNFFSSFRVFTMVLIQRTNPDLMWPFWGPCSLMFPHMKCSMNKVELAASHFCQNKQMVIIKRLLNILVRKMEVKTQIVLTIICAMHSH